MIFTPPAKACSKSETSLQSKISEIKLKTLSKILNMAISVITGRFINTIAIRPKTATEFFNIPILPTSVEYDSLMDDPITGIRLPIANLILLAATESVAAENMPLTDKTDAKVVEINPKMNVINLFIAPKKRV